MKLATYEIDGAEHWGFVINHPSDGSQWVFDPQGVEDRIRLHSTKHASLKLHMPRFFNGEPWPNSLVSFLDRGEEGMNILRETIAFVERFLVQDDQVLVSTAGYRIEDVQLRAPIPRPRLVWGLVGNSAQGTRFRADQDGKIPFFTLLPRGHQRPASSIVGPGQPVIIPESSRYQGYNVELGVVIGKRGRFIGIEEAVDYIAGYTVINDIAHDAYFQVYRNFSGSGYRLWDGADFLVMATCSWGGKKADTCCAMGPFLVTKDEVGDPYNLLTYTRQSGVTRSRTHTSSMLIGIERAISWYSSFATLYPGDVIHMASMGYDGLLLTDEMPTGPDDSIEVEIENIGTLKNPVVHLSRGDWRDDTEAGRPIHDSPAAADLIKNHSTEISRPDGWDCSLAYNFWTIYCNYKDVLDMEGLKSLEYPRFLNTPNSSLAVSPAEVGIPHRATSLDVGIEIAFVIGKLAAQVRRADANEYILGYTPMISIQDNSFFDAVERPQGNEEKLIHAMYCRWADGFNVVRNTPVTLADAEIRSLSMDIHVEGIGDARLNSGDYIAYASESLEFITRHITLFPGDVVTLGRAGNMVHIPEERVKAGVAVSGSVDGLGEVGATLAMPAE